MDVSSRMEEIEVRLGLGLWASRPSRQGVIEVEDEVLIVIGWTFTDLGSF